MAHEFKIVRRVEFAETDLAGIMHFANYFRHMEAAEHAFFRSLGLSIHMELEGRMVGWPRVNVSCEYKKPLRFEEEVEVHLIVREKKDKSLSYDFLFRRVDPASGAVSDEVAARGSFTAVCVTMDDERGRMRAIAIPGAIASKIEAAPL
jgi:acyl-CoA thioester hydrolase